MGMRPLMIILATVLSAGASHADAAATTDPVVTAILERARLWESRNRFDLAREALDKLFRLAPDHPDALALLVELEARGGQTQRGQQALSRLLTVQPNHPRIAPLRTL